MYQRYLIGVSILLLSLFPLGSRALSPTQCDTVYAVHDQGIADSQFFTYQLTTAVIAPLGPLYPNYNIEAIAIDPQTHLLYAASNQVNSQLYLVDGVSGELQLIGAIGFDHVTGLSFQPLSKVLWGWSDQGLVQIDLASGAGTLVFSEFPAHFEVQELVWDQTGSRLYAVVNADQTQSTLWVYDGSSWQLACTGLPHKVESLERRPDGLFLYGFHGDRQLGVHLYNVQTCQPQAEIYLKTPDNDIEGIAWPTQTCSTAPSNLEALRAYLESLAGVTAVTI